MMLEGEDAIKCRGGGETIGDLEERRRRAPKSRETKANIAYGGGRRRMSARTHLAEEEGELCLASGADGRVLVRLPLGPLAQLRHDVAGDDADVARGRRRGDSKVSAKLVRKGHRVVTVLAEQRHQVVQLAHSQGVAGERRGCSHAVRSADGRTREQSLKLRGALFGSAAV